MTSFFLLNKLADRRRCILKYLPVKDVPTMTTSLPIALAAMFWASANVLKVAMSGRSYPGIIFRVRGLYVKTAVIIIAAVVWRKLALFTVSFTLSRIEYHCDTDVQLLEIVMSKDELTQLFIIVRWISVMLFHFGLRAVFFYKYVLLTYCATRNVIFWYFYRKIYLSHKINWK